MTANAGGRMRLRKWVMITVQQQEVRREMTGPLRKLTGAEAIRVATPSQARPSPEASMK